VIVGPDARRRFAIAPDLTLLNHGSFGSCPREVLASQQAWRDAMEADPIAFMEEAPARVRAVVQQVAPRLGAQPDDVALVENATTGVSAVLRSLSLKPGDRLVTTSHVYGAVRNAMRWVAERAGATVEEVPVAWPVSSPDQVVEALAAALPGARLAVLDWITSPTGMVWPIEAMVRACQREGVPVLVDAAHAPGHVPVDLDALGADYTTGNLHKWLFAAKGTAVLHVRRDRQAEIVPLVLSHDLARGFPQSFDQTATRDLSSWLSTPTALAFVDELGQAAIWAHNNALCARMAEELADTWGVTLPTPATARAALATLPTPGDVPAERAAWLHAALQRRRIEVPCVPFAGRTWVRISAQVYNHPDEYRALGRAVLELLAD
jgi:isopenicillin-N epimerase